MRHITRKPAFSISENKASEQLCSNHTADQRLLRYIKQFLYFLNSNSQASSHLLWLYSPVCVGPGQKPLYWFSHYDAHLKAFWFLFQTAVLSPLLKRKPESNKEEIKLGFFFGHKFKFPPTTALQKEYFL